MKDFDAIAFDIDGTLYPSWKLNIMVIPYVISHFSFFIHYSKVRKILHNTAPLPDFFEYQARLLSEEMNIDVSVAKELLDKIVYDGLKPFFKKLKPYKHIQETFKVFKEAGYKLALLSDFPPEQKGDVWGVVPYCDVVLGTETIGALKPSKYPYGILAMELNVKPERILYVGNSVRYDVIGSKKAGFKSAYLESPLKSLFHKKCTEADITFRTYRQLQNLVLK